MINSAAVEALIRRDQLILGVAVVLLCLLCWVYVLAGAGTGMSVAHMTTWEYPLPALSLGRAASWDFAYWLIMFLMWWVMMIAMMVPSAAPMILLYGRVYRHNMKMEHGAPAGAMCGLPSGIPIGLAGLQYCRYGSSILA